MVYPVLIYDNLCYWCTKFSKFVNVLTGKQCLIVGHYTDLGKSLKQIFFPESYDGTEMSWFVIDNVAYGGRSGLFQLIKYILFKKKNGHLNNEFDLTKCDATCKGMVPFFKRSISLFKMSREFNVQNI